MIALISERIAPTRPLSLNKSNSSELSNVDVLSLLRQTTCSANVSIHYNTLKVSYFSVMLVGLSQTEYTVSEGVSEVEVCASRLGNTSCRESGFSLIIRSEADSAGIVHSSCASVASSTVKPAGPISSII